MKLRNAPFMKNGRRIRALRRLKHSLVELEKNPYPDKDYQQRMIARIQKEMSILESRILNPEVAIMRKSKKYRGAK